MPSSSCLCKIHNEMFNVSDIISTKMCSSAKKVLRISPPSGKDGLARTVKVFMNGARTSLLLSTGVPAMQTWPIIRNERRFQLLHCF